MHKKQEIEVPQDFKPQDLLVESWLTLSNQIKDRELHLQFAHMVEADLTVELRGAELREAKLKLESPELPVEDLQDLRYLLSLYNVACDSSETPAVFAHSKTKLGAVEGQASPRTAPKKPAREVSEDLLGKLCVVQYIEYEQEKMANPLASLKIQQVMVP